MVTDFLTPLTLLQRTANIGWMAIEKIWGNPGLTQQSYQSSYMRSSCGLNISRQVLQFQRSWKISFHSSSYLG